jgi:SAM-dependent methyltransferase
MRAHLDDPAPGVTLDPLCGQARGWIWLGEQHSALVAVELWANGAAVGQTRLLEARPDVNAGERIPAADRTGFELTFHAGAATHGQPLELVVRGRLVDGTVTAELARVTVHTIRRDYRQHDFGVLLDERTTAVQREQNIFATGPSQSDPNGELATMLRRHLGAPPRRVLDVGCGLGSYGRGLRADGYEWLGVEIDAADCAELTRLGLPHVLVDGRTLPFPDGAFDAALCLEVLEHIDEPRSFLREVSRVAPRQLIVSVPNCELLGYLWEHLAAPWHMLESTHVNYFTRWSLGSLLREFYPHVEFRFFARHPLRTAEGTDLHYNLLAIATR